MSTITWPFCELLNIIHAACDTDQREQEQQTCDNDQREQEEQIAHTGVNIRLNVEEQMEKVKKENAALAKERKELQQQLHEEKLKTFSAEEKIQELQKQLADAKKELKKVSDSQAEQHTQPNPVCSTEVVAAFSGILGNEKGICRYPAVSVA